jgi:hypothetical protein
MRTDISIIGDLCDNDLNFCTAMLERGLNANILCNAQRVAGRSRLKPQDLSHNGNTILTYSSSYELLKMCFNTKLIVSFTGALAFELGRLLPFKFLPGFPPVINFFTGSDITELAEQSSRHAKIFRFHIKTSALNWCPPYPHAIKNVIKQQIPNIVFMRYPYLLAEPAVYEPKSPLTFFHPSRMDWKVNDPGNHRNSSKGNNRFIAAFIRALENGLDAKCIIIEHGMDIEEARQMISKSKVADKFIWKSKLTQLEAVNAYKDADIVVDQFDIGGLGGIAIEAMSAGRPVLSYINECSNKIQYGADMPPVLNCWSEEEIYRQIMRCQDVDHLKKAASDSLRWIGNHHNPKFCLDEFLFYYSMLTGDEAVDYGWHKNAYAKQDGQL